MNIYSFKILIVKGKSNRGSQTQIKGGIFKNKKDFSIYMLNGKNSRKGDFRIMGRLKINEERGPREEVRGQRKKPNGGNNRKQEETQFFLKNWR